jgi:hypothetical protein
MDTTKNIWEYLFLARVPLLESMSVEQLRRTGVRVSGNKRDDENIKKEWLTTYLSISKMVDYHREGTLVKIVNYSDLPIIYDFISKHLSAWKEQLEYGINIGNAPIDDLVDMDTFATAVYEHAVHQFSRDQANSLIARHMAGLSAVTRQNFFRQDSLNRYLGTDNVKVDENGVTHISNINEQEKVPERESLGEFFKDRMIGYRRY